MKHLYKSEYIQESDSSHLKMIQLCIVLLILSGEDLDLKKKINKNFIPYKILLQHMDSAKYSRFYSLNS